MPQTNDDPVGPETTRGGKLPAVLAVLAPMLALWVVQPWIPSAFPVWDYAEMLPLMRSADGLIGAFAHLAEFTRFEGRANYLTYLQIAGTWLVVGDNPTAWQWQRAVLMLVMGMLFALVVRRYGGCWLAAGAGALLAVITISGVEGWLFLMGEPLAAIGLLLILLIMPQGKWPTRWRTGIFVALAALAVMLSKELIGLLLPVALLVGFAHPAKAVQQRAGAALPPRQLVIPLLLAAGIAGVNVLMALRDAIPTAYAKAFQPTVGALGRIPVLLESMLLPARFVTAGHASLLYPANLVFLGLLAAATIVMWREVPQRFVRLQFALLLIAAPLIGAIAYAFWPRYSAFYGIPFTLGGVGLFAASLTLIERRSSSGRLLAWLAAIVVVGFTGISGHKVVGGMRAFQDLAAGAVGVLAKAPSTDTVLVVKAGPGGNRWPVTGPELAHYAEAISAPGTTFPEIRDASCEEVAERLKSGSPGIGYLNDQNRCGPLPQATMTMVAIAPYLDWTALRVRNDTLKIQLLLPPPIEK